MKNDMLPDKEQLLNKLDYLDGLLDMEREHLERKLKRNHVPKPSFDNNGIKEAFQKEMPHPLTLRKDEENLKRLQVQQIDDTRLLRSTNFTIVEYSLFELLKSYRHYSSTGNFYRKPLTLDQARIVRDIFDQLQLPVPLSSGCIKAGCDGILIPLNEYGLMLRIEVPDGMATLGNDFNRVNNSRWALKPIAAISADRFIVELCPGTFCEREDTESWRELGPRLREDGYRFSSITGSDTFPRNIGRVPLFSPDFPKGQPVVYDRFSIRRGGTAQDRLKALLPRFNPQDILYEDLAAAFKEAWPDTRMPAYPAKMHIFWDACKQAKKEGRLIAGWQEFVGEVAYGHAEQMTQKMAIIGDNYERFCQTYRQEKSPLKPYSKEGVHL